jgi:hypothetical protein
MSDEAPAPVHFPLRAATPVKAPPIMGNGGVAGDRPVGPPDARKQTPDERKARARERAVAWRARKVADAMTGGLPSTNSVKAVSGAVTAIAGALEPLSQEDRQRALDAVVVMLG